MPNTHCKDCVFSNVASDANACKFDIPQMVIDNHNILVKDNYNYIENYKCFYGFSRKILEENKESLSLESIENMVLTRSKIRYYLVLDIRSIKPEDMSDIIYLINNLDIKPQYISFIILPQNNAKDTFKLLNENLKVECKWKLHTFLENMPLNDVVNISAETNLNTANSSILFVYDYSQKESLNINNAINYMHYHFIIKQDNLFGISHDGLHGLCLPIAIYRSLLSLVDRDIIKAINDTPVIKLSTYEIEKST
jgi:hypothetical protein